MFHKELRSLFSLEIERRARLLSDILPVVNTFETVCGYKELLEKFYYAVNNNRAACLSMTPENQCVFDIIWSLAGNPKLPGSYVKKLEDLGPQDVYTAKCENRYNHQSFRFEHHVWASTRLPFVFFHFNFTILNDVQVGSLNNLSIEINPVSFINKFIPRPVRAQTFNARPLPAS